MKWISILALFLSMVGCSTSKENDPDGDPKYEVGSIVYHVLDGRKMIVERNENTFSWRNIYSTRYFNDLGELQYLSNLGEYHLMGEKPREEFVELE